MLHEVQHGPPGFPLGVYENRIPKDAAPNLRFIYTHFHHHFEFIWVRSGAMRFELDGERFAAQAGDVLIVGSGRIHAASSIEGIGCEALSVVFDLRLLYGERVPDRSADQYLAPLLSGEYALPAMLAAFSEAGSRVRDHLSRLAVLYDVQGPGFELMMKSLLLQCFFEFARGGHYSQIRSDVPKKSERQTERLKEILEYIDDHLAEKLSVERLAGRVHVSATHFHTFFRRMTGQSPIEYINGLRLARARTLLTTKPVTVQEAAHRVGFENVSYFIRAFKQRYGMTPAAYVKERGPFRSLGSESSGG
jgi:AraC-like DNA-binding protein